MIVGAVLGVIVAMPIVARDDRAAVARAPVGASSSAVAPRRDPIKSGAVPGGRTMDPPVPASPPPRDGDRDPAPASDRGGDVGIAAPARSPPSEGEEEPQLLQRALAVLATSPSQALALTDEHARRFPAGALGQERERIAIEALVKLGQRGAAVERATRFLAVYPRSAHRSRIEAVVGQGTPR